MTTYEIRPVRAHEWQQVRDLRLTALQDEAAPMAFLESYEAGLSRSDDFWQQRARGSSADAGPEASARQFVAVAADGSWVGSTVALVERAGGRDVQGEPVAHDGGHLVGVFVHPDHRGQGLVERLFEAASDWLRELDLHRARLFVTERNARAQAAYRRCGFVPTGHALDGSIGPEIEMARLL